MRTAILVVFFALVAAWTSHALAREWKDNTGKFSVEATLVGVHQDQIVLEQRDGKSLVVPLSRICTKDLKEVLSARGDGGTILAFEQLHAIYGELQRRSRKGGDKSGLPGPVSYDALVGTKRVWTDAGGNKIVATLLVYGPKSVLLRHGNDKDLVVDFRALSTFDQQWMRERDPQLDKHFAALEKIQAEEAERARVKFSQILADDFAKPKKVWLDLGPPPQELFPITIVEIGKEELLIHACGAYQRHPPTRLYKFHTDQFTYNYIPQVGTYRRTPILAADAELVARYERNEERKKKGERAMALLGGVIGAFALAAADSYAEDPEGFKEGFARGMALANGATELPPSGGSRPPAASTRDDSPSAPPPAAPASSRTLKLRIYWADGSPFSNSFSYKLGSDIRRAATRHGYCELPWPLGASILYLYLPEHAADLGNKKFRVEVPSSGEVEFRIPPR